MSNSHAYHLLDSRIQRFLWEAGWSNLRYAQEHAIAPILAGDRDVVIAAQTASGKTEAAMLPALTSLLQTDTLGLIVYISPLKALINDQFQRLDRLCERLEIPVWPWHGDVSASVKQRFRRQAQGVLLITPESLEAMLCTRGTEASALLRHCRYLVVDELHAFIGTERGKQLQCLMHRIEALLSRPVARIGLSATLGDMQTACSFLRPARPDHVALIEDTTAHAELRVIIKGVSEPAPRPDERDRDPIAPRVIAADLFEKLRNSNNLVFPNQRRLVELFTNLLNECCEKARVPSQFFAHHGNLSADVRTDAEFALKRGDLPVTAVCTNTLELGIDVGAVKSVVQIDPPPSVASLRQRLGRSGRRDGEAAILRGYVIELGLSSESPLSSLLRLNTAQFAAMLTLLMQRWYEPPKSNGMHGSTLVQQILSIISQFGGISAARLFELLAGEAAPFHQLIDRESFVTLLRALGEQQFIEQGSDGSLLLAKCGERYVGHYSFYASFATEEEFRLEHDGKLLGTLPVDQLLSVGQRLLFAGRRWEIAFVDTDKRVIGLTPTQRGAPPLFLGSTRTLHTRVRQTMKVLLGSTNEIAFLDAVAREHLDEGRAAFERLGLADRNLLMADGAIQGCTWLGHSANEAIVARLRGDGFNGTPGPLGFRVEPEACTLADVEAALTSYAHAAFPPAESLLSSAQNLDREKWEFALPPILKARNHASLHLAIDEAQTWLNQFGRQKTSASGSP